MKYKPFEEDISVQSLEEKSALSTEVTEGLVHLRNVSPRAFLGSSGRFSFIEGGVTL